MNWKKVDWNEVLEIKNGKSQKKVVDENGQYPIYGSGGLMGYANDYLCDSGTTIIGRKGSINNPIYVNTKFWNVDTAFGLCPGERLDNKYFYYFCLTYNFLKHNKATTLPSLTKSDLLKIQIPLPPLPIQKKIAAILDAASAYQNKTKALIEKYDELTQSLFLEMFGDPVRNPNNWEISSLVSNCEKKDDIKCGPFGTQLSKSEYVERGIPIWGIPQVNSSFEKKPTEFVTEDKAVELKAYSVRPGDIVMSRKGNVGKCALFSNLFEDGILHSDVLRIRTDSNKVLPVFLVWQFRISRILQTQVSNVSNGAIMAGINVTKLKKVVIQTPPLELQKAFAERVFLIEKQKKQTSAAIDNAEQLFQSLLQKAFKGELIN